MILDSPCEKGEAKWEFPELSDNYGVTLPLILISDSVKTDDLSAR